MNRESSARGGWLSSFFSDDATASPAQAARRRFLVAFALAIAVHETIAGLVPWQQHTIPATPKETLTFAKVVRIEHRPKPTPRPKPKPTPQPVVHAKVIAETHVKPRIVNPGSPSQHQHIKRIASARPLVHTQYHSKPTIHVPTGGQGAGTSKTAKPLTGGVGPGGTGTGESGTGIGTGGAPAAHEPCGYVDFRPNDNPTVDKPTGRVWEHITMTVHFPDGSDQAVDLDYAWYFANDAQDPWSEYNEKRDPNYPVTFQFPPDNQRANEPPVVQYVMTHTTPDGFTTLRECPK